LLSKRVLNGVYRRSLKSKEEILRLLMEDYPVIKHSEGLVVVKMDVVNE